MTSSEEPTIRQAAQHDIEALYELLQGLSPGAKRFFHPHPFDKPTLTRLLSKPSPDQYYIMVLQDDIIGYAMLRFYDHAIPTYGCCIRHGYEGKGYGTTLTAWVLQQAKDQGIPRVILKVYKENTRAYQLYTALGFSLKHEDNQTHELLMEHRLDNNEEVR